MAGELTSRERLRRCYAHEPTDRPGVYSRVGYPRNDPTYDRLRASLEAHSDLKRRRKTHDLAPADPTKTRRQGYSADFERLITTLHGPRDFADFNARYDRPIFDLVHDAGGRVHVHCHGSIAKVFDGFLEAGVDVLHPFEAPPMGDITAAEAKRRAAGQLCLEGNIQIADMYESTPEEIRRQTESLIAECFADRTGLIVSPTASPYIRGRGEQCFPQYKAMVDAVLAFTG
jgi:hypothetical protein